ncbi:SDR family oxidoreductase [Breznakia pachnodae]|uniref:3-oxoacyl-[acyl-carrier protein] reductase n=1 Tax=Breznakia pachnodae TaxID=265178 RepID=A0ABU0E3Q3_9FIRM|nr:SDR family oxidoreductase [Breznakia pachnodae]MDQ0361527.1 3-oxoacyl-[acyl-carrier protein] reductase [Breznakia pachnodae]
MIMNLSDKVVLITGGTGEIGKIIGLSLLENGARIIVNYYRNEEKKNISEMYFSKYQGNYFFIKADISDKSEVNKLMIVAEKVFGPIDILINCAAISENSPFLYTDIDIMNKVININLFGTLLTIKYFIKLRLNKKIKIINIGSRRGREGIVYNTCYSCSKSGLIGLTKSVASELRELDISISLIYPPSIPSSINKNSRRNNMEINIFKKQIIYMCSDVFFNKQGAIYQLEGDKYISDT